MKPILIVGAGGFAKEVKCLIDKINSVKPIWNLLGFVDDWGKPKGDILFDGYSIWGNLNDLNAYEKEISLVIALGNPLWIKEVVDKVNNPLVSYPNLVHPNVEIHSSVKLGNIS